MFGKTFPGVSEVAPKIQTSNSATNKVHWSIGPLVHWSIEGLNQGAENGKRNETETLSEFQGISGVSR
jgi:hypothetical protein